MIFRTLCVISVILLFSSLAWAGTFTENFDSGKAKNWEPIVGDWEVENGAYTETAETSYAKTMFGDEEWKDYTVEVDVTLLKSVNQDCAGLLLRADKEGELGFRLWIRTDMAPQLSKWTGDNTYVHIDENLNPVKINIGQTYHLRAVLNGNKYQFFIDDEMIEYEDKENFRESGRIGFICSGAYPAYDNLVISGPEIPSSPVESKGKLTDLWGSVKSRL